MSDMSVRLRRLRHNPVLRDLVRETRLSADDFIAPLFVCERPGAKEPIASMPGVHRWGVDRVAEAVASTVEAGVRAVLLFGIPASKDSEGRGAWDPDGVVQQAIRNLRNPHPDLLIITDVCLCEYTDHGHCGYLDSDTKSFAPRNDETLAALGNIARSHAEAGADVVAPSGMMDGMVAAIRGELDEHGFSHTPILSYAVKYASAFYGPFREAAEGAPAAGDRKSHQMDPGNRREARREAEADLAEGADMLMLKPAAAYLDVLADLRRHTNVPLAAYQVSGEYSMLKAAAANGWIDERPAVLETLTGIKRAGADLIVTYYAAEAARWL